MNQAERAGRELRAMDDLAAQDSFLHRLSPLSKLFVTIFYLAVVVSFSRYRLTALVWMVLFPVAGYQLAGIALRTCFQKLRLVLPLVCAVGLLNPIFDRQIVAQLGTLAVSGRACSACLRRFCSWPPRRSRRSAAPFGSCTCRRRSRACCC